MLVVDIHEALVPHYGGIHNLTSRWREQIKKLTQLPAGSASSGTRDDSRSSSSSSTSSSSSASISSGWDLRWIEGRGSRTRRLLLEKQTTTTPETKPAAPATAPAAAAAASTLAVVSCLVVHPCVLTIQSKRGAFLQNKWARYVIQTDRPGESMGTKLWTEGLRGKGEIIAVADTGIDHDSCWFHDPNRAAPIGTGEVDMSHRKIVYYDTRGDDHDYARGHGSQA
mmetsp:Transcript_2703/g.4983  ORF Transcript_2703/g.4983 Transcript_2703/m.4983 type:complete len:225 (+) Transcript_2703:2222-2896(+)